MRESNYCLRVIKRTVTKVDHPDLNYLIEESTKLKKYLDTLFKNPDN